MEAVYASKWAMAPPSRQWATVVYAVVASLILHVMGAVVYPYVSEMAPVPPPLSLAVELLPPPEEKVLPPPPPVRVNRVVPQPRVVPPVPKVTPVPVTEPPPKPVVEQQPILTPIPSTPVAVAQPDVVATKPVEELKLPEVAMAPEPTPPDRVEPQVSKAVSDLPVAVPWTDLTGVPSIRTVVKPIYPKQMEAIRKPALVRLEILLDELGVPRQIKVIESAGMLFDEAAIVSARTTKYAPGRVGSLAVATIIRVPIRFTIP